MTQTPDRGSPHPGSNSPRPQIARRGFVLGAVVLGGAAWAMWPDAAQTEVISASTAFYRSETGSLTLIDVRRPDEWARTGLGQGAHPIDMRRGDFTDAVLAAVQGDKSKPIALICARGVRSRGMSVRLTEAGFSNIVDVSEGMEGSAAGAGWVAAGLPVTPP